MTFISKKLELSSSGVKLPLGKPSLVKMGFVEKGKTEIIQLWRFEEKYEFHQLGPEENKNLKSF